MKYLFVARKDIETNRGYVFEGQVFLVQSGLDLPFPAQVPYEYTYDDLFQEYQMMIPAQEFQKALINTTGVKNAKSKKQAKTKKRP